MSQRSLVSPLFQLWEALALTFGPAVSLVQGWLLLQASSMRSCRFMFPRSTRQRFLLSLLAELLSSSPSRFSKEFANKGDAETWLVSPYRTVLSFSLTCP